MVADDARPHDDAPKGPFADDIEGMPAARNRHIAPRIAVRLMFRTVAGPSAVRYPMVTALIPRSSRHSRHHSRVNTSVDETPINLQQLRYLAAVVQCDLSITAAARHLRTSQPGVSKSLRLFEAELGAPLFHRDGQSLTRLTRVGGQVTDRALRILAEIDSIRKVSEDVRDETRGRFSIGTTHTQARYVLPEVFQAFRLRYPEVQVDLHQGTSEQIAEMMKLGQVDFQLISGQRPVSTEIVTLPCYRWERRVIVPQGHPLANAKPLTLQDLAAHPIVTYVFSLSGQSSLLEYFASAGLTPKIALSARDADVIKTYVRLGFGTGIVASMAKERVIDDDLVALDASHLFPTLTTWIGFRRGALLRRFMFDFIELLAPHLDRETVERALSMDDQAKVDALLSTNELPLR